MSEGNSPEELKEKSIKNHYGIATNPDITNEEVKEASAEALHHISSDIGNNRYLEVLRKLMFKKKVA